jgi:tRNA(Ile)-lysidine synthase
MTGHSADDNAETILMKMLNKSPWYEWTGIPRRRGNILRPLLPIRRRDVRSWVTERGVPFLEDETNDDQRFARNALRKRLEQCPVFLSDERIANLIGESRQLACHLHHMRQLSPLLTRGQLASPQSDIIGLEIERILQYFNKLAFIPVEAAWSDLLGDSAARLPSALRRQISQFVYGNASQSALTLPGSVLLERRDRALWLSRASLEPVSIELKPESAISLSNRATVTLAAASDMKIDSGWRLRNWQPGDRVKLPNRPRKKVSDLLCERKLDPLTRRRTLVLTHQECLVCVLEPKSAEYCFQLADGSAWRVTYNLDV